MTIKQFAKLCDCNPQTLRYYDHVDLLKPVRVDEWSGYRFYEEDQALTYVKIKNLQKAGFSIDEIKELLDKDNQAVYKAFEAKIAEEERRLQEIKEIQKSYQTEMDQMKNKIEEMKKSIMQAMAQYDATDEFDISAEDYQELMDKVETMMDQSIEWADQSLVSQIPMMDVKKVPESKTHAKDMLKDPLYDLVYEKHGWNQIKEIFEEFSTLEDGAEYFLCLEKTGDEADQIPFINVLLNQLIDRNPGKKKTIGCDAQVSKDGQNHVWMFKKKILG